MITMYHTIPNTDNIHNNPKHRVFSERNKVNFKELLSQETWQLVYESNRDVNETFKIFHDIVLKHFNAAFPLRDTKNHKPKKGHNDTFMTPGLLISQKKVRMLKKLSLLYPAIWTPHYVKRYKYIYFKLIRAAKKLKNFYTVIKSSNKSQTMWDLIRKRHGKPKVQRNIDELIVDGKTYNNHEEIATNFSNHYIQCIEKLKSNISSPKDNMYKDIKFNSKTMFLQPVTNIEIQCFIKQLKNKKSSGFDELSDCLMKHCSHEISEILTYLINKSFETGIFPEALKVAIIKPLYKKGDHKDLNNYRPVSLLSVFSKIFEHAFLSRMLPFLEECNILSKYQHGFRKAFCTETAIFELIDSLLQSIDQKVKTIGLFLDLSKAFDMVDPETLLHKLYMYGIRGPALNWLRSFLIGRKQKVNISVNTNGKQVNYYSKTEELKYGIGQGTKLGPILFLLYINDLPLAILSECCSPVVYADDSVCKVTAKDTTTLEQKVQVIFSKAKSWLDDNELVLNVNKTEIIQFQNIRSKDEKIDCINIENVNISLTNTVKFLGVFIDDELRFNHHVSFICKKLSSVIFALGELRHETEINCLLTLYFANFHSILKYGIVCWGNSIDSNRVFLLQKRAIRTMLFKKRTDSCKSLFQLLGILPFPCVYIYECALFVKRHESRFREHEVNHKYITRNRDLNIAPKYCKLEMYRKGPFMSCVRIYNHLSMELKSTRSLKLFSKKLKDFLLNKCFYNLNEFFSNSLL
jgi:hypothetical protein